MVQLRAARGEGGYEKRLLRFTTADVLIVDDLGLRGLTHDEPTDLYEIVRRRYEHGSTIITSNRLCGAPHKRFNAEEIVMLS